MAPPPVYKFPFFGLIVPWSAALRAKPSVTSNVLEDLPRGLHVHAKHLSNGWLYVEAPLKGKVCKGYVSRELVAPLEPAISKAPSWRPENAPSSAGSNRPPPSLLAVPTGHTSPRTPSTATPARPASSRLKVIPCNALPKLLLHDPGGSGRGPDFAAADSPSLGFADAMKVSWAVLRSDAELLGLMNNELFLLAGFEGSRMVAHFATGGGTALMHTSTSPIGSKAESAPSFVSMRKAAEDNLAGQLSRMAATGTIDCNALVLASSDVPRLSFTFSDSWMLKAIIGGTQGRDVILNALSVDPTTRKFTMQLRYNIFDDFGVDTSDLYSPSLIAFWVLQHQRTGFNPFLNIIDLTVTTSGSV